MSAPGWHRFARADAVAVLTAVREDDFAAAEWVLDGSSDPVGVAICLAEMFAVAARHEHEHRHGHTLLEWCDRFGARWEGRRAAEEGRP